MALSLSGMDVSASLRIHQHLLTRGLTGGYAENAIHTDSFWGTRAGVISRLELTPIQTTKYRHDIAQAKAELRQRLREADTRRQQILSARLPVARPLNHASLLAVGKISIPHTNRRRRLDEMIDATINVDAPNRMGFDKATDERIKLISRIPSLDVVENGNHIWGAGTAKSFGLGRALGYLGEIPNEVKFTGDHQLSAFLENYSRLRSPRPGSLVVYRDEEGRITVTALFLGQAHGLFRVQSKILESLPLLLEHNLEDVPPWFGVLAEFYDLSHVN